NPAARRMFGLADAVRGLRADAVDRGRVFRGIVERALAGEPVPATEYSRGGRHLLVTAQPLPQGGAVLVLVDVTELRRLEGVRRDFVANASHDLKTPVTAIRGYAETLLADDLPEELRQDFASIIHRH